MAQCCRWVQKGTHVEGEVVDEPGDGGGADAAAEVAQQQAQLAVGQGGSVACTELMDAIKSGAGVTVCILGNCLMLGDPSWRSAR